MAKYRRSYRLDKELFLARKKIAKCEAMVRGGVDRRKVDIQQELFNSLRKVGHLEASCCSSLEKENRLEQEISLCRERTCDLEAQLLSCGCNVTNLETTRQSLENKNEDLHRELLKTDQKNADMEITLESVQRERGYLKNGEAQLNAKANEYETRIKKLESDKEILEEELLKLKGIIYTLECQIGTLIQNKTDLTAELKEARKSVEKSEREYASLFGRSTDGRKREETSSNPLFVVKTHNEKSTDEIRRLHEVATDLETKYDTCKTELGKQQTLIKTIISREQAAAHAEREAAHAAREAARDLQLQLDENHLEIEKRDVMMKTLEEDKRGLERNIQEFQRYYQQKCNYFNAELDHERTLGAEHRIRANVVNTELQDSAENYQQAAEIIAQDLNRQKNISSVYNSHEQKRATLQHKGSKFAHDAYAKLERGSFESGLNAGESLRERKKDVKHIFRGHLSKKRQEELTEAGAQRQFHASVKSTNENAYLEWNRQYESQYRECCHEQNALKTLFMAAEERIAPVAEMEDDLDDSRSAEYKNISEEYHRDVDGVRSENDAVDIEKYSSVDETQELKQEQVVSNIDEMTASSTVESEFTNGHASPIPGEDENDSVTKVAAGGFNSLKTRKEELEQLCEVLMEERNRATGSLKEREDEVLRLRLRSVETEHEKVDLKTQLAKVLGRSDLLKNELESTKEENEKLRAEVERLRKRIQELEAENSDLQCKLQARVDIDHADGKKAAVDVESAELSRAAVEESVTVPSAEKGDESQRQEQELPNIVDKKTTTADEAKTIEVTRKDAAEKSASAAPSEVVVTKRENRRTAPNYYRHSFAGSLPRPFQSFDLHSQHSFDHSSKHERSESIHSDTSGDSAESESHAPPSIPSFMRRKVDKPYQKSGYSPVQFNYQPLPESISSKRGSWLEGRARGGSLNRAHDSSSDSESSAGVGNGAINASVEKNQELVAREELVDTLNSAPEMLDAADGKSGGSETEKYGLSFQLHSQSLAKNAPNSANDLPSAPTHEFRENVPSESTGAVQSNGQAQVDGEEKKKPEHVSDLVSMWNSKTEVYDI